MNEVPFYSNTEDDTHCFQAAFRMVLKYFLPEREFSWRELEQLSAKVEGLSTWPQSMFIELVKMNFEVIMIEGFNAWEFIRDGSDYLQREFGDEVATWQTENSDISAEQKSYQRAIESGANIVHRIPSLEEMQTLLSEGYVVVCTVNSRYLNDKSGYVGHSVVVLDVASDKVTFHDPGLPAFPNRKVSCSKFEAAWADPNEQAKDLIAIRLKSNDESLIVNV